jgi:asparagine synthase (glutamine-hydrolysing)
MCGIWAYIELITKTKTNYEKLYQDFMKLKPRGPDMSSFQTIKNVTVGFHRLAIMDPTFHANQPYIIEDGERTIIFICNGEIYNFKDLIRNHDLSINNNSDCMTIPRLYLKYVKYNPVGKNYLNDFVNLFKREVRGEFAFVLFEFDRLQNLKAIFSGRDQIGIRPLYYHPPTNNSSGLIFSSEIKGMTSFDDRVTEFEPGTILEINFDNFGKIVSTEKYDFKTVYQVIPINEQLNPNDEQELTEQLLLQVRESVVHSVKRRLQADCTIGYLLSGGLDSSLTASIGAKLSDKPINTFCCGLIGTDSTDIRYARLASKYIKSRHTEVMFTIEEALSMIETVVRTIESYCITSVRASIPQYLVSKYISENTEIKVLITGETSDEVASGYLYNYYAPSGEALHEGAKEYVKNVHMYDGRRCDRCISGVSCEARIPLADPEFIEAYWKIPSKWRHPNYKNCEKWWLRKAFDGLDVVHPDILWRRKEAFSDGISGTTKSWFQILQEHIETLVTDEEFSNNKWNCKTKEEYYYKKLFVKHFGEKRLGIIPGHWQPKWNSSGQVITGYVDPSARTLDVYKKEEQNN